jgi:hypothetical protein
MLLSRVGARPQVLCATSDGERSKLRLNAVYKYGRHRIP